MYRVGTMKRLLIVSIAAMLCFGAVEPVAAQGWNPPSDAQRCPSKWGAGDTRGSANHVKPATVLAAMQLVKTGQIIELGRVLDGTMPVFGTRRFDLHTKRTVINPGRNRRGTDKEIVIAEIGQVGTQFDAFPHQMIAGSFYNCVPIEGNESRTGFGTLGVDGVGSLVARGVLIDVAGLKGVPVHQVLLVVHGIHTLENLKLDVLAAERVQEFAFVVQPLKIKGGTGSTVAPIAIR